jgi:hypothetical protein
MPPCLPSFTSLTATAPTPQPIKCSPVPRPIKFQAPVSHSIRLHPLPTQSIEPCCPISQPIRLFPPSRQSSTSLSQLETISLILSQLNYSPNSQLTIFPYSPANQALPVCLPNQLLPLSGSLTNQVRPCPYLSLSETPFMTLNQ